MLIISHQNRGDLGRAGLLLGMVATLAAMNATAGQAHIAHQPRPRARCNLTKVASAQGPQVTYGLQVTTCKTRYGLRFVRNVNVLYNASTDQVVDASKTKKGKPAFDNTKTFTGSSGTNYRARADVRLVLKASPHPARRRDQRWHDPGPNCHRTTTFNDYDTLACTLLTKVP